MTAPVANDGFSERAPIFRGELCVHALAASATCQACVKVCPHEAWILDDSSLNLDLDACDGCGLCQAACPEGAIEIAAKPSVKKQAQGLLAFAACEKVGASGQEGILPCLHALGLRDLLALYQDGVRNLVLAKDDCSSCVRGSAGRLETIIGQLNMALDERGLTPISVTHFKIDDWHGRKASLGTDPRTSGFTRRGLLRLVAEAATIADGPTSLAARSTRGASSLPQALLVQKNAGDHLPHQPVMTTERCVGCDACTRICPHDAILLADEGDGLCYRLTGEGCTGCGLCVDVCEQDAIRIDSWVAASPQIVPLRRGRCRGCGATFHQPSSQDDGFDLCRVCRLTSHRRQLFQVLD